MSVAKRRPVRSLIPDLLDYRPAFSAVTQGRGELVDHHQRGLGQSSVAGQGGFGAGYPGFWRDLLRSEERALGVIEHVCGKRYRLVELDAKVRQNISGQHFEHRDPAVQARQFFVGHRIILWLVARIKAALLRRVE